MVDVFWDVWLFTKRRLQKFCGFITNHKFRVLEGWTEKLESDPDDYRPEYYYRCKLCRKPFWNYENKKSDKR